MSKWQSVQIRELLSDSFAGDWGDNPNPHTAHVLRATDIDDDGNIVGRGAPRRIASSVINRKGLNDGDTLLEASGGSTDKPVGRVAYFDEQNMRDSPYLCSNFFKTLRPKKNIHDPKFIFWKLHWFYKQSQILAFQQQTTGIINLKFEEFLSAPVHVPSSVSEESTIAKILDTLDTQIRQTEALIAKLERIKQGLLTDLLTRGIDQNGQLRPTPDQAPHLYKDSPLGRIPREWEVKALRDCVATSAPITYGIVQAGPHIENGIPYIRTGDMGGDELQLTGLMRTSEAIARQFERSKVRAGEIVCAIRATVGKVLPVPEELDGANLTQGTARISPASNIENSFLLWCLRSPLTGRQFGSVQKGTTFQEITLGQLQDLQTAIPASREEQKKIANSMTNIEDRRLNEKRLLVHLVYLRRGLMDDLLTGRVRVTPLLEEAHRREG